MQKILALYGNGLSGTLRVEDMNGVVHVRLFARGKISEAISLYLVSDKGRIYRTELDANHYGRIQEVFNVKAAFAVKNGQEGPVFILSGGKMSQSETARMKSEIMQMQNKAFARQNEVKEVIREADSVKDEEFGSEAMRNILQKARELFAPLEESGSVSDKAFFNPFPDAFPRSVWKRIEYPGTKRHYLEGQAVKDGMRLIIYALPGEYSPVNPMMTRNGFKKFMRASDGSGYWLKIKMQKKSRGFF
ncbi:MAG: hypothetical protein IJO48_00035 [Clostridia bacterium]|nr:hypothetical protein [Clostridia bacterium]